MLRLNSSESDPDLLHQSPAAFRAVTTHVCFWPSVYDPCASAGPDREPVDYPDDGDRESHHAQDVAERVLAYDVLNNVVLPERPDGPKQPK